MRWPCSLQARLALGLGLGLAIVWLVTAWITTTLLQGEMNEVFDSTLEETAQRILPLAVLDILNREETAISQRIATLRQHEEFFTYIVRDDQGRVLLRSHGAKDSVFPPFEGLGFHQTPTHRIYYDAALQGTITIAVAEPLNHRVEVAREALVGLAFPLIVVIPLSLIGIFIIVWHSLDPVRRFSAELASRDEHDLSAVDNGNLPSEITPVAEAVNQLLNRLRRVMEAERSFTANAAHELRTPVAAALAQVQRLMTETSEAIVSQRGAEIEASLKRLNRLSEKLLQLARAEGGRLRRDTASDIRPVLRMIVSEFERIAGTGRIEIDLPGEAVLSDIDPDAFAILARNLIENGLRHGTGDTPIQVVMTTSGKLRVINDGPLVPPETLAKLTARFERGHTLSAGGGLGLSIAQTISDGTKAALILHSPAPGRVDGFEAEFEVPIRQ